MRTIVSFFLCLYSILPLRPARFIPRIPSPHFSVSDEPKVTSLGSDTSLPKVEYNGTPLLVDHTVCNLVLARDQKGVLIGLTEADSRRCAELIRPFGFSERPGHACINYEYVAEL